MAIEISQEQLEAMDPAELLATVVGEGVEDLDRVRAWSQLNRKGYAGSTVIDEPCNQVRTVLQLWRHLRISDGPEAVDRRGHRLHTPDNTQLGSIEDTDYRGPAHAFGAGR